MADLRVKLFLDLVNRLSAPAKAAAKDLQAVEKEVGKLGRTRGSDELRRDLARTAKEATLAHRALAQTAAADRRLAGGNGAERLGRDLRSTGDEARRARREIEQLARRARDLNRLRTLLGGQLADARRRARAEQEPTNGANRDGVLAAGRGALATVGGVYAARAAVRGTVGSSVSFEAAMADVRKKVDGVDDPAELARVEKLIRQSAVQYGRPREEVAKLVAEAGAGGITKEQMPDFLRITLAAATAWDTAADQASASLAKIRAATQWANPQLEQFVDKVNALSDAGAAKEMDVVDMFQRAGAAAKAANVDFDASLAFLTAMNNIAMDPQVAARGFAAFASTLRTAATGNKKTVAQGLQMIGLSAKQVEAGMKTDSLATMVNLLERLERSPEKASAAIKIFGQEWWDEIARAGQALPEIRKNLAILSNPGNWSGSAQKNLNIELSTTESHLERLKTLASEVGDRLGRWTLPGINAAIERVIKFTDEVDDAGERQTGGDYTATEGQKKFNRWMNAIFYGEPLSQSRSEIEAAREPLRERNAIESKRAQLAGAVQQAETDAQDAKSSIWTRLGLGGDRVKRAEAQIAQARRELQDFDALLAARDETNLRLAGVEGQQQRVRGLTVNQRGPSQAIGPASLSFGLQGPVAGAAGPQTDVRTWLGLDGSDFGSTIMQRFSASIAQGGQDAQNSARIAGEGIKTALSGIDLTAQGQAIMDSLAAGIRNGGAAAVAAAESVAASVRAAAAKAGGTAPTSKAPAAPRLSGALHDGVTPR
jgi:TP901 family phage tail tape measure protein